MLQVFNDSVSVRDFGFSSDETIPSFSREIWEASELSLIPSRDSKYIFPKETLSVVSAWWEMESKDPLFISGPHGSGKTSFVNQFCARVGVPVISVTARSRLERTDLIGHYVISSDRSMRFADGPLTRAWRKGCVFLVNEMSAAPADLWLSINELLEGAPLYIEATGEVVERNPRTRIVMTDNLRGLSDDSGGAYLGRYLQDPAVMDRCWKVRMEYIDAASEETLLAETTPQVEVSGMAYEVWRDELSRRLRRAAARVREAYCGVGPDSGVEATISTRVLLRFRDLLLLSCRSPAMKGRTRDAVRRALRIALTDSLDPIQATIIEKLVEAELGDIGEYLTA